MAETLSYWIPTSGNYLNYKSDLLPDQRTFQDQIEEAFEANLVEDVLFAGGSRDFESLGLGLVWVRPTPPISIIEEATATVIRILGMRRRWIGSENVGQPTPPSSVNLYLEAVARRNHSYKLLLQDAVETNLGAACREWLLIPRELTLISPRPYADGQRHFTVCRRILSAITSITLPGSVESVSRRIFFLSRRL